MRALETKRKRERENGHANLNNCSFVAPQPRLVVVTIVDDDDEDEDEDDGGRGIRLLGGLAGRRCSLLARKNIQNTFVQIVRCGRCSSFILHGPRCVCVRARERTRVCDAIVASLYYYYYITIAWRAKVVGFARAEASCRVSLFSIHFSTALSGREVSRMASDVAGSSREGLGGSEFSYSRRIFAFNTNLHE